MDRSISHLLPCDPPVLAILYPISDAAIHSTRLPHNRTIIKRLHRKDQPSSQASQPAGIEQGAKRKREGLEESDHEPTNAEAPPSAVPSGMGVIMRHINNDLFRFTLGSSWKSYMVLQADPISSDRVCDINSMHCHFYPDSNSSDIWLKNKSTSTHEFKRRSPGSSTLRIGHEQSAAIQAGIWDLSLGDGLQFILEIPPRAAVASATTWLMIPPSQASDESIQPDHIEPPPEEQHISNPQSRAANPGRAEHDDMLLTPEETDDDGSPNASPTMTYRRILAPTMRPKPEPRIDIEPPASPMPGTTSSAEVEERVVDGVTVAVKVFQRAQVPGSANAWKREVTILSKLGRHLNVSEFVAADAARYELIMSYIPGLSIDKYLDAHHLSTLTNEQCDHIWQGAAAGLAWIHGKGILYNDLKPGNTMYHAERQVAVLIDFDIADYAVAPFFAAGTPFYLAPEYKERKRLFASDVWAMGVMMLFALGMIPLPDTTQERWHVGNVFDPFTPDGLRMDEWVEGLLSVRVRDLLPEKHQLLGGLLQFSPEDRLSADELVERLNEYS